MLLSKHLDAKVQKRHLTLKTVINNRFCKPVSLLSSHYVMPYEISFSRFPNTVDLEKSVAFATLKFEFECSP